MQGLFGSFALARDYYYHAGKAQGHYPADAALGLEVGYTPALARILCLAGAHEASYQKAQLHLAQIGGLAVEARRSNGWCSASVRTPRRGRSGRSNPTNVAPVTRRCFT